MKNKKLIGEILFLLLVFGVTVYMVFRGEDLHQTLAVIAQVRKAGPGGAVRSLLHMG